MIFHLLREIIRGSFHSILGRAFIPDRHRYVEVLEGVWERVQNVVQHCHRQERSVLGASSLRIDMNCVVGWRQHYVINMRNVIWSVTFDKRIILGSETKIGVVKI